MKGIFIRNATVPNSCYECEYGMGSQVECPYYERPIKDDPYRTERHPDCIITEIDMEENEPVEPITDKLRNKLCPRCNTVLKGKYCHECGQSVLWEGR